MARITSRVMSAVIFLAFAVLVQMPIVIQSINAINLSSGFISEGLQKVLLVWLIGSFMIAISFEWISLLLSIMPFIITLPLSLIYTTLNPAYVGIILENIAIVVVLVFTRMAANML
ncbi:MAG: hypothetical protein QXO71_02965 [Candidatus Jordarchaeaceae archaeon]